MVVVGASETVLAIDFGDVVICGRLCTLWFGLFRLVCETLAAASMFVIFEPLRELTPFFLSLPDKSPTKFVDPLGLSDPLCKLSDEVPSLFVEKISLILVPGEMARPSRDGLLLEDLSCDSEPSVAA